MNELTFFGKYAIYTVTLHPVFALKNKIKEFFSATVAILNKICYNIIQIIF